VRAGAATGRGQSACDGTSSFCCWVSAVVSRGVRRIAGGHRELYGHAASSRRNLILSSPSFLMGFFSFSQLLPCSIRQQHSSRSQDSSLGKTPTTRLPWRISSFEHSSTLVEEISRATSSANAYNCSDYSSPSGSTAIVSGYFRRYSGMYIRVVPTVDFRSGCTQICFNYWAKFFLSSWLTRSRMFRYFRTGNAGREFNKIDEYVYHHVLHCQWRRGGQRTRFRFDRWPRERLYEIGLHRLRGTVKYPKVAALRKPCQESSSVSCVRENRMHSLKGGAGNGSR